MDLAQSLLYVLFQPPPPPPPPPQQVFGRVKNVANVCLCHVIPQAGPTQWHHRARSVAARSCRLRQQGQPPQRGAQRAWAALRLRLRTTPAAARAQQLQRDGHARASRREPADDAVTSACCRAPQDAPARRRVLLPAAPQRLLLARAHRALSPPTCAKPGAAAWYTWRSALAPRRVALRASGGTRARAAHAATAASSTFHATAAHAPARRRAARRGRQRVFQGLDGPRLRCHAQVRCAAACASQAPRAPRAARGRRVLHRVVTRCTIFSAPPCGAADAAATSARTTSNLTRAHRAARMRPPPW